MIGSTGEKERITPSRAAVAPGRTGASLIPEAAQAVGRNNIERLQIGIKHVDDDYCWKRDHRDNRKTMTSKGTEMLDFFTTSAAVLPRSTSTGMGE